MLRKNQSIIPLTLLLGVLTSSATAGIHEQNSPKKAYFDRKTGKQVIIVGSDEKTPQRQKTHEKLTKSAPRRELASRNEPMVSDPALERRLTVTRHYVTRESDTLKKVARSLYAHSTWWPKIVEMNPQLRGRIETSQLPTGTRILYRAPEIGTQYYVQKNDSLSRIAQWKYGEMEFWQDLYELNKKKISDPSLIYPGDLLVLEQNGTIKKMPSGQILVNAPDSEEFRRKLASQPEESGFQKTIVWFAIFTALLALMALVLWRKKIREESFATSPPIFARAKRPKMDLMGFDKSLMDTSESPENSFHVQKPGYHSLVRRWWKRFLKRR